MTKLYGFEVSGFRYKNGSVTLKSRSRSLKLGQCSYVHLGSIPVQVSCFCDKLRLQRKKKKNNNNDKNNSLHHRYMVKPNNN